MFCMWLSLYCYARPSLSDICLSDVCLSDVCRVGPTSGLSREQTGIHRRGLGRPQLAERYPRHTWLGHHFQGQKVKDQGHQAGLVGCSSHYIMYIDETSFDATPRASRCLSIMNIHGAGRRRRKSCRLWTGGGPQRAGILCRHAHSLFLLMCCRFLLHKMYPVSACLDRWLSGLRHSAHRPERSAGWAGVQSPVGR